MWLRRHDERNEARSVERFSSAMRVLSRRGTAASHGARTSSGSREVVMPARARVTDVHVTGPSRERRPIVPLRRVRTSTTPVAARPTAPSTPAGRPPRVTSPQRQRPGAARVAGLTGALGKARSHSGRTSPGRTSLGRTSLVVRRRRTLVGLAATFALLTLLWLVGVAPVWAPSLGLLLVVAYVVHLRFQAKVASQTARRRTAVDERSAARAARRRSTDLIRAARARGIVIPDDIDLDDPVSLNELLGDEWDPRDVLLPTYVTKPTANRLPDTEVAAFWGDAQRDDEAPLPAAPPAPASAPMPVDEHDEALDDELGAIIEHRRVVGE